MRPAGAGAFLFLGSVLVPGVPIVLGMLVIVATAVYAGLPVLRPWLEPVLRVPVALARKRQGRLLLVAGCGLLLVLSGFVGAKVRGNWRSRSEQREVLRDISEQEHPLDR